MRRNFALALLVVLAVAGVALSATARVQPGAPAVVGMLQQLRSLAFAPFDAVSGGGGGARGRRHAKPRPVAWLPQPRDGTPSTRLGSVGRGNSASLVRDGVIAPITG